MAFLALGVFFGSGLLIRAVASAGLGSAAAGSGWVDCIVCHLFLVDVLANASGVSHDLSEQAWYLLDVNGGSGHVFLLLCMIGYAYVYYLVYKYRYERRTVTAFGLMALAYLPVVGQDGFHYWFGGAVMRANWPTMAHVFGPTSRRQ